MVKKGQQIRAGVKEPAKDLFDLIGSGLKISSELNGRSTHKPNVLWCSCLQNGNPAFRNDQDVGLFNALQWCTVKLAVTQCTKNLIERVR